MILPTVYGKKIGSAGAVKVKFPLTNVYQSPTRIRNLEQLLRKYFYVQRIYCLCTLYILYIN